MKTIKRFFSVTITSLLVIAFSGQLKGQTVIFPTESGINWNQGSSHEITWTGFVGSYVKIELFKGSSFYSTIETSTENDGGYTWSVPLSVSPGNDYQIKITSTTNTAMNDISDNWFSIIELVPVTIVVDDIPSMYNNYPNQDDLYKFHTVTAEDYVISVNVDDILALNSCGDVSVSLYDENLTIIGGRGTYSLNANETYYIKVHYTDNGNCGGQSYFISVVSGISDLIIGEPPISESIEVAGDVDWFYLNYNGETVGNDFPGPLYQYIFQTYGTTDTYMYLYRTNNFNGAMWLIASNDNGGLESNALLNISLSYMTASHYGSTDRYIVIIKGADSNVTGPYSIDARYAPRIYDGNLALSTQAEVDAFNYTEITGSLSISGSDITDLTPLNDLTSVGGELRIQSTSSLTSLSGLDNLSYLGGALEIIKNTSLTSLSGLDNITSVARHLYIRENTSLTSLSGLDNITSEGGDLYITGNTSLTSLSGLDNLTSVGGDLGIAVNPSLSSLSGLGNLNYLGRALYIYHNDALTSLSGIENLTRVAGPLVIIENPSLTSLSGLDNLTTVGGNTLSISKNPSLTSFCSLYPLLSEGGLTGTYDVYGNALNPTLQEIIDGGPCDSTKATLGHRQVYAATTTAEYRRAVPVTFSENGEIESISIYHNGGTGNVLLGVYSDASGSPSSLLGVTPSTLVNPTEGWQTVPLSGSVPVSSGQTVWLSWVFENNPGIRFISGTPARANSGDSWSGGMPASFGAASFDNYRYSIYCSYAPEAGGTATATLGNTEVYAATTTVENRRAVPVTFSENGEIESISIYHNGGTGRVKLGVYSDVSGSPSYRLGVAPSTVVNPTEGWQTVLLSESVSVSSGQTVWLAWDFDNNPGIRFISGTPARAQSGDSWPFDMPRSFGAASFDNYRYSIYCSYAPVGGRTTTATLGNTEIFAATTTAEFRCAVPVTFSEDGEIESISIYHNGGTGHVLLGVYSDASGSPSSRLGVTPSTVVNPIEGWQTVPLSGSVSVSPGQTVWLSWVFENNPGIRFISGTPARANSGDSWFGGMPVSFGAASFDNYRYSIYCSYATEGGGTTTATLGNMEIFAATTTAEFRRAVPVTFSENGEIESISIYHNSGYHINYERRNVILGVYSDASGSPSSRLGVTPITVVNPKEGWQTVPLAGSVSVSSGQTVWLSWIFENNPGIRYISGTPARANSGDSWSGGMPASFGAASFDNYRYSIYCSYTTGGTKSAEAESQEIAGIESQKIKSSDLKVYPNPFSDKLYFEFMTAKDADVVLEIYNLGGQSIVRLLDQRIEGGVMNRIEYVPIDIISGIYIYRLTLDKNVTMGKVIYNKR